MEVNWIGYAIVVVITTFIVSIITENIVIKRIQCSEGVNIIAGKCMLKQGYVSAELYNAKIKELEDRIKELSGE
jgi:membrane-bound acyltransferase YfiQ involved in biofilm formation